MKEDSKVQIQNKNDAKIVAYLEEHGPCRQWEILANVGLPESVAYGRLLRLEARQIVVVEREPTRGVSSLKATYYLATDENVKHNENHKRGGQ